MHISRIARFAHLRAARSGRRLLYLSLVWASMILPATGTSAATGETPAETPGLIFEENFDDEGYRDRFTGATHPENRALVDKAAVGEQALRFLVREGGHYGGSLIFGFADAGLPEPEHLYIRYHLRFGADWEPGRGGKLPGPAGTYDRAGWGGRIPDGTDGWSARGGYRACPQHEGRTQLFFYTYHADLSGDWGENLGWDIDHRGCLPREQWHQIDMYVRMNTPGERDGVLRAWVNGDSAFERTDLRFRNVADLKIEQFWMNLYHGGSWTAPRDMHVYWDGIVLSSEPLLERAGRPE